MGFTPAKYRQQHKDAPPQRQQRQQQQQAGLATRPSIEEEDGGAFIDGRRDPLQSGADGRRPLHLYDHLDNDGGGGGGALALGKGGEAEDSDWQTTLVRLTAEKRLEERRQLQNRVDVDMG
eukprot:GHVU01182539.1.p1 GENE.GHVU01182539.1~~GHVU01182539.1.p1  ORF type:complete len:135 (+),score=40.94 GHVU01182539.1:45-407(+)